MVGVFCNGFVLMSGLVVIVVVGIEFWQNVVFYGVMEQVDFGWGRVIDFDVFDVDLIEIFVGG